MEFINTLDTYDPSIRLKYKINDQSIDFLDTTIYKGTAFHQNQTLDIKVYFKETDTHALLFKTSFHPKHTYKGLVKSQLIRFKRICTQDKDFKEAVDILFGTLRKRGYSRSLLRHCLRRFQVQKPRSEKDLIPLVTTYSSISARLNNKIKNNYQTLITNQGLLENSQVISAYRRNKNLRDYLVRAKLQSIQQPKKSKNTLQNFIKLKYVQNKVNKRIFKLEQTFHPLVSNCVYIIICSRCGKQYVGETKNSISMRMWQHRYNIKNRKKTDTPIVKHFILHGLQSLEVAGLQSNSCWTDRERKTKERMWIRWLDTKEPSGLNIKYN